MPKVAELSGQFGRYQILKKLGEGGMGAVYLAEDAQLGRRVALKVPLLDSPEAVQRFQREARAAAAIDHPNVCPVYEIGNHDGTHYLTMPFIDGQPLARLIDGQHGLPVRQAVGIVHTLALALQTLHERGLMHRDLKPANVMLKRGREPILMDFGLARSYSSDSQRMTQTGAIVGTPAYMSPEQINGDMKALGPTTDIYGLGVILFELLTGQRPFDAPSVEHLYFLIFQEARPKPSQLRSDVDTGLDAVCLRALAKKPCERFASMAEFATALAPWLAAPTRVPVSKPTPQRIACPHCGKPLRLAADQFGKRVRCPTCKEPFRATELATLAVAAPPRPPGDTVTPVFDRTLRGRRPQPIGVWLLAGVALLSFLGCGCFGLVGLFRGERATDTRTQQVAGMDPEGRPPVAPPDSNKSELDGAEKNPPRDDQNPSVPGDRSATEKAVVKPAPLQIKDEMYITNSIGMKLALIPAGKFMMGSPDDEADRSSNELLHDVAITKPFYLGVHEVTQEQYERMMGTNPSCYSATGNDRDKVAALDTRRFPVETVSWMDADDFCKKLSALPEEKRAGRTYGLPTEAQWEYACRGGSPDPGPFYFKIPRRSLSSLQANFDGKYPYGGARKGRFLDRLVSADEPGYEPNVFGLFHMHGNVWEWCQDRYEADYYKNSRRDDPPGPSEGSARVMRGGCWGSYGQYCRAAARSRFAPTSRSSSLGFRVALVPSGGE